MTGWRSVALQQHERMATTRQLNLLNSFTAVDRRSNVTFTTVDRHDTFTIVDRHSNVTFTAIDRYSNVTFTAVDRHSNVYVHKMGLRPLS